MARSKSSTREESGKSIVAAKLSFVAKWCVWLGLAVGLYVLHDLLWYSSFNPLYRGSQVDVRAVDSVIKGVIMLVVYKHILPCNPALNCIIIYSVMLSWLAVAQNLPHVLQGGESASIMDHGVFKVLFVHIKYGVTFTQKFLLFRAMDVVKCKLDA